MNWTEICKSKDLEAIRQALTEGGDVNWRDSRGRTPLMLLITNRAPVQFVELLMNHGTDLEIEDKMKETALIKAVKFNQPEIIDRLLEAGSHLDSPHGILGTAWHAARKCSKQLADKLLKTTGALRLTLTDEEQETVDAIIYEESLDKVCGLIQALESPVLLQAVVEQYNWDDGPQAMLTAFSNPNIAPITLMDMYELLDGDYWVEIEAEELRYPEDAACQELALKIRERLRSRRTSGCLL